MLRACPIALAPLVFLACGDDRFVRFPPPPAGARSAIIAYLSSSSEPRADYSLSELDHLPAMRGDLDEVIVAYFDLELPALERAEACERLFPEQALRLLPQASGAWEVAIDLWKSEWLGDLLVGDVATCAPCYRFADEAVVPGETAQIDLVRVAFTTALSSGAFLVGGGDQLSLVRDDVRSLSGCGPAERYDEALVRAPGELYLARARTAGEGVVSEIFRAEIDELSLECREVWTLTSTIPGAVAALGSSAASEPLELLVLTTERRLLRWTPSLGFELLYEFAHDERFDPQFGSIVQLGPSSHAVSAAGDQVVHVRASGPAEVHASPVSLAWPRGVRGMSFVEGVGLFAIEGRDQLVQFDEDWNSTVLPVPSSLLLSHSFPLDRGVLLVTLGGGLVQYAAGRGFCPTHGPALVMGNRQIDSAAMGPSRLLFGGGGEPTWKLLQIPFDLTGRDQLRD